jgi:hypothetical protein
MDERIPKPILQFKRKGRAETDEDLRKTKLIRESAAGLTMYTGSFQALLV